MSETTTPRVPERAASKEEPDTAPGAERELDGSVTWPRDLNAPSDDAPLWGTDPETLRDA